MMENLLEDLESCLTSRKSSICPQSTTTSPKEERTSKKRVQFEVTVLATGTDRDLTLTNDSSGVRSPVLCRTSADLEKQFHQHHCPHHYHENNPNGRHSTKTKKNIEEEMKIENFSCPSSGNLVEESAISSLSRSQAGNTESSNISEYMWYKRNIAVCHRRLG